MIVFIVFFLQLIESSEVKKGGVLVDYETYSKEAPCGDFIWDEFTEECDGTTGCGEDCLCMDGYTATGDGNCTMSCVYGNACYSGCTAPDFCEICNVKMGYTADCQGCAEGYLWNGVDNCVEIPRITTSCGAYFDSIEQNLKDPNSQYYQNALKLKQKCVHDIVSDEPYSISIPKDEMTKFPVMTYARCSPYINPSMPLTYGQWFQLNFEDETRVAIEIDQQWTTLQELYLESSGIIGGNNYAVSLQEKCPGNDEESTNIGCIMNNGGTSHYVESPRLYYHTKQAT